MNRSREMETDSLVLELLNKISSFITHEADSQKVLQGTARLGGELCHAPFYAFLLKGEPASTLPEALASALSKHLGLLQATLEEGQTRRSLNLGDPVLSHGDLDGEIRSYLAAPVKNRLGHVIGGLFMGHPEPDAFGDTEEQILTTLARLVSVSIESMITIEHLLRKNEELSSGHAELTESTEKIKAILDTLPQKTWVTDHLGKVVYLNRAWTEYTHQDSALNLDIAWGYFHPEDQQRTAVGYFNSLVDKGPFHTETRVLSASGEYRWHILMAKPIQEDMHTPWVCSLADIHDKKIENQTLEEKIDERTQALQRANLELERSNFDLMQFASVASHDLKEPLRKVQTYSSLIERRYSHELSETPREYLGNVMDSVKRMYRLIDDILLYSKTSHAVLDFEPVQLDDLLTEIAKDLDVSIRDKKARLVFGNLCTVRCVKGQMRQVLQNLLSNSLKFTFPDRPPVIEISASTADGKSLGLDPARTYCKIRLADNGIGFDIKYVSKIFTAFQRLQNREDYEGTGIGLAIVKKIIERHNGDIQVESVVGKGSAFTIILPLS